MRLSFMEFGVGLSLAVLSSCSDPGANAGLDPALTASTEAALADKSHAAVNYAAWAVSPQDYNEATFGPPPPLSFTNQTLRHTMQVSIGGKKVRVRFSNLFGTTPLVIDGAHVARATTAGAINVATDKTLKVAGAASFTIAPGAEVWSDAVALEVAANSSLSVSLFVANTTPASTSHSVGLQTTYIGNGNLLGAASFAAATTTQSYYWVTGIDVSNRDEARVVVVVGDSITDGFGSTVDANHRFTNYLSMRLAHQCDDAGFSVVNEGMAGNRNLSDGIGPSGLNRFDRDVLGQSGVTDVVVLLSINDIGFCILNPGFCKTTDEITTGLSTLITRAKARGLKIQLGTLLPFKNAVLFGVVPYYSAAAEVQRQAVNTWIRSNRAADGIVDFDAALRDPADALSINPTFDSGDHLHPNDLGYAAMADVFKLRRFEGCDPR